MFFKEKHKTTQLTDNRNMMLLQIEMVISSFFIAIAVDLVLPLTINICNCYQQIVKGTIDLEDPEYCSHPEPVEATRKTN